MISLVLQALDSGGERSEEGEGVHLRGPWTYWRPFWGLVGCLDTSDSDGYDVEWE